MQHTPLGLLEFPIDTIQRIRTGIPELGLVIFGLSFAKRPEANINHSGAACSRNDECEIAGYGFDRS
jgi:hypothetical protein